MASRKFEYAEGGQEISRGLSESASDTPGQAFKWVSILKGCQNG